MAADDRLIDHPTRPPGVPCQDHGRWQVQHDRQARYGGCVSPGKQRAASARLHVRRIDDGQQSVPKAPIKLAMESPEGGVRGVLVCLVAGDQRPEGI